MDCWRWLRTNWSEASRASEMGQLAARLSDWQSRSLAPAGSLARRHQFVVSTVVLVAHAEGFYCLDLARDVASD